MALFTVTAFKWTGTFYNAQYNTSYTATFDDDDGAYQGSGDTTETVSINNGPPSSSWGQPHSIDVNFTDVNGQAHVETFYFFNTSAEWYFVPAEDSDFTVGATLGTYQSHTDGWNYSDVVCFAKGTLIGVTSGAKPVEQLEPGDYVQTLGGPALPLRLNLKRSLSPFELMANPTLRPVCIEAGALGVGLPASKLYVSRQHRMLVASAIGKRMFGKAKVLIAAIRLTILPGCYIDSRPRHLTYHHLVFDEHAIVFANGAPSESFFPGPQAVRSLTQSAHREFTALFPDAAQGVDLGKASQCIPSIKQQKQLLLRHLKNGKPLLTSEFRTR
ncbi:Hint domain-containing protein [Marivita sp.]|uniref:Hint domain-containing protein n=1 Tax=Marivita sp. TaxID=2003365 RepID=UPI003F6CD6F0